MNLSTCKSCKELQSWPGCHNKSFRYNNEERWCFWNATAIGPWWREFLQTEGVCCKLYAGPWTVLVTSSTQAAVSNSSQPCAFVFAYYWLVCCNSVTCLGDPTEQSLCKLCTVQEPTNLVRVSSRELCCLAINQATWHKVPGKPWENNPCWREPIHTTFLNRSSACTSLGTEPCDVEGGGGLWRVSQWLSSTRGRRLRTQIIASERWKRSLHKWVQSCWALTAPSHVHEG